MSTLLRGIPGPMPKDTLLEEDRPHTGRVFASGVLTRTVTAPSRRYWQAHWATESGHLIYGYLDLSACERLVRARAGLEN